MFFSPTLFTLQSICFIFYFIDLLSCFCVLFHKTKVFRLRVAEFILSPSGMSAPHSLKMADNVR